MSFKKFGLLILASLFSLSAHAEIDAQAEAQSEAEVESSAAPSQVTKQEVYVIQGQDAKAKADAATVNDIVAQPITVVEAAPLVPSRADQVRAARKEAEVHTEQKIVEKLETSRLEDERRRAERLFGDRFDNINAEAQANALAKIKEGKQEEAKIIVVQAEAEAEAEAKVIEKEKPRKSDDELKAEIAQSVKEDLSKIQKEEKKFEKGQMTFSGTVGSVQYDAINIGSDLAVGGTIGWMVDSRMLLEAGLQYSNHTVDENPAQFQEMDQYNWTTAVKYSVLPSRISPVVGALGSVTYRTYSVPYHPDYSSDDFDSLALDVGLLVGAEARISKTMVAVFDYRYMINLATRYENEANNRPLFSNYRDPIEEEGYESMNLGLRFEF